MGNHRFRLSDMMPNAWFYKLKDMGSSGKTSSQKKKQQKPSKSKSKSTSATTTQRQQAHHQSQYPRKSYYFTRELTPAGDRFDNSPPTKAKSSATHFLEPPRKSSKQKRNRKRPSPPPPPQKHLLTSSSSVSAGCSCRATIWTKTEPSLPPPPDSSTSSSSSSSFDSSPEPDSCYRSDRALVADSWSISCGCNSTNNSDDIKIINVVDVDNKSLVMNLNNGLQSLSDLQLPPIITKPAAKFDEQNKDSDEPTHYRLSSAKIEQKGSPGFRKVNNSPGVRLRMKITSPRIGNRRIHQANGGRRSSTTPSNSSSSGSSRRSNLSESFAVIKSSFDPQRDFRESMVEMIVENNIKASKDLEDLLACYLSLNSDEYHELIIKVFKQIWFDLTDIKLKP